MDKEIEMENKAQVSWSKVVRSEDGSEVRISVEKIENGFLKTTNTDTKDTNGNWEYKTVKEFSEKNPFEDDDKGESEEKSLVDKLSSLFGKNNIINL